MTLWLVLCERRGEGENYASGNSVAGISWPELADLSKARSINAIRQRIAECRPDAKPSTVTNWAGQVDAFANRIKEGDLVALPLKSASALVRCAPCVPAAGTGAYGLSAKLQVRRPTRQLAPAPSQGGSAGSNPVGATTEHQHNTAADL
jgi:hypothetical protein